jgi:hypothetical protein
MNLTEGMGKAVARARSRVSQTRLRVPAIWLRHHNLDPRIWWRHRGIDSSDVFVASYPRSGTYWVIFQLIEILTGRPAEFDTMYNTVPVVGWHREGPRLLPGGGRLIQTHERYRPEYKKAIYLVRDARDVVLSQYRWDKCGLPAGPRSFDVSRRADLYYADSFDRYFGAFLDGKNYGFAPWPAHVSSWLDSPLAQSGDLVVVRYEDMSAHTAETLVKIVRFLGVDVDRKAIQTAIMNNTLERMRAKEDASTHWKPKQEEGRHAGKGKVGGWRARLTEAQVQLMEQYAGRALARLGYPTGTAALGKENQPSISWATQLE